MKDGGKRIEWYNVLWSRDEALMFPSRAINSLPHNSRERSRTVKEAPREVTHKTPVRRARPGPKVERKKGEEGVFNISSEMLYAEGENQQRHTIAFENTLYFFSLNSISYKFSVKSQGKWIEEIPKCYMLIISERSLSWKN